MSRTKVCLLLISLALLLGVTPLAAQDFSAEMGDCTVAQPGDSFWRIANYHLTADQWKVLWDKNPKTPKGNSRNFFQKPGSDWLYLELGEGEVICGLKEAGIVPTIATHEELANMGLLRTVTETREVTPQWLWWILPLALLAIIALAIIYAWFRRDPTRVGAGPVWEEGAHSPQEAARHFRAQLQRDFGPESTFATIISMVRGRAYGWARVSDNIGLFFRRILSGEETWQATARFRDGSQVIRYSLMGCANDVRAGGGMLPGLGFRFVAEENVTDRIPQPAATQAQPEPAPAPQPIAEPEPTPQPEPVPAQAAPAPTPVPVITPSGEFVRNTDAPTTSPEPTTQKKGRKLRFSVAKNGNFYSKMDGFTNLSVEEDEEGSLIIRADR